MASTAPLRFTILKLAEGLVDNVCQELTDMKKYNLYASMSRAGRFELIKEIPLLGDGQENEYWAECFTWEDLKRVIPYFKSRGWKIQIEPIEKDEIPGKMHIYSFTCGINHDIQILDISGIRIIMARDDPAQKAIKNSSRPRY